MRRGAMTDVVRRVFAATVFLALTGATLTACGGGSGSPQATMQDFVAAWNRGDWVDMSQFVEGPSPDFATAGPAVTAGLAAGLRGGDLDLAFLAATPETASGEFSLPMITLVTRAVRR